MMKRWIILSLALLLFACNSEDAGDCLQTTGDIIIEEFTVGAFTKVRIEDDVSLVIRQGPVRQVLIETGENLLNDVSVSVEGDILVIRDSNRCNFFRDYGVTRAIVTTPELTEIRNASEFNVVGQGVLRFPFLLLVSNTSGGVEDARKSGDFTLTVECEKFFVDANGFSGFYIDGTAEEASITFQDEAARFEGENFVVDDLKVFHRSANKMIVNPQNSIEGRILGTGDVISVNRPPIVDVEELYTGRLIFRD